MNSDPKDRLERILSKKKSGNHYKYLVKWRDFPEKHSTWETIENLFNYIDKVEKFETQMLKKKTKRPTEEEVNKKALPVPKVKEYFGKKDEIEGDIKVDKPLKIEKATLTENGKVQCLVEWETREDGTKPKNSILSNEILKKFFPAILCDFYESRIKSIDQNI